MDSRSNRWRESVGPCGCTDPYVKGQPTRVVDCGTATRLSNDRIGRYVGVIWRTLLRRVFWSIPMRTMGHRASLLAYLPIAATGSEVAPRSVSPSRSVTLGGVLIAPSLAHGASHLPRLGCLTLCAPCEPECRPSFRPSLGVGPCGCPSVQVETVPSRIWPASLRPRIFRCEGDRNGQIFWQSVVPLTFFVDHLDVATCHTAATFAFRLASPLWESWRLVTKGASPATLHTTAEVLSGPLLRPRGGRS